MRILMMTNTYSPHVGGVARSVGVFSEAYRELGHDVLVVAPEFEYADDTEADVVRVPAIQKFNGSDFSVALPDTALLEAAVDRFEPHIVHSHHPFLLGSHALRIATTHKLPLVFTHHTMYEQYTHYAPGDSQLLKRFVESLSTHYANLCDQVFAPSASIEATLIARGVETPIAVVPTGLRKTAYTVGNGRAFRQAMGMPRDAYVVGHVGRLAEEKNLLFLTRAVASFMQANQRAWLLMVGSGPCAREIRGIMHEHGVADRLLMTGVLEGPLLGSAYRAMDVFAFASQSETQGMVLTEAMAARVPVVALDGPGVREVVDDGRNGRLLMGASESTLAQALADCAALDLPARKRLRDAARRTAQGYAIEKCASKALALYAQLRRKASLIAEVEQSLWEDTLSRISAEWKVFRGLASAAGDALAAPSVADRLS